MARRNPLLPLALVLILGGASRATAQGAVHVVDALAGPGSDFTTIQAAVDAAVGGDVLLVRAGVYPGFGIDAKPLTVAAEPGAAVSIDGVVLVQNLASGADVLLTGLEIDATAIFLTSLFDLRSSLGPIWIEDCVAEGAAMFQTNKTGFVGCSFVSTASSSGLSSFGSNVAVWRTDVSAGDGTDGQIDPKLMIPIPGNAGTSGYRATAGDRIFLSDCNLQAGDGGDGVDEGGQCSNGGAGGDGLDVLALDPEVYLQATTFLPGAPGLGGTGCSDGTTGVEFDLVPGAAPPVNFAAPARRLLANTQVAREGENLSLTFEGELGDVAFLLFGFEQGHSIVQNFQGALMQDNFTIFPPPLTLNGAGQFVLSFSVPELGPGIESLKLYLTPFFVDPGLAKFLGAPTAVVLLDNSF